MAQVFILFSDIPDTVFTHKLHGKLSNYNTQKNKHLLTYRKKR